ncbi:MAG TPA: response regulator [Steroidobacteraceae bacterium]|nr:response regulator [Steroidobacteraceae bacterium]
MSPVVHVVDDDDSARTAVLRLLGAAGYIARGYGSAGEFLMMISDETPGCLVLDVRMPGPSGLELQEALARRRSTLPVVFLTGYGDIPMSVRAIKAGAVDFLTKPVEREALIRAVRSALERDARHRRNREQGRALRERFDALTPRERDVFVRVVSGKLNKQIAADLGTAERTVKAHRAHVMEKLNVASVAELVHVAEQLKAATHTAGE